jgi:hypothetical protein
MKRKVELTAIIVNDQGEVFTHWASGCSINPSGYESYYSVPQFAKTRTIVKGDADFWPSLLSGSKRKHYTIHKPHLFPSEESARKAMRKMWGFHRMAVVS